MTRWRRDDDRSWPPKTGWYRMCLARGGWKVPCRIIFVDGFWSAEIDGQVRPGDPDPAAALDVDRIWHSAERIEEWQYRFLTAMRERMPADHPARNPLKPIEPMLLKPLEF